jgi:hypothetical protein
MLLAMRKEKIQIVSFLILNLVPPLGIEPSSDDYKSTASPFMLQGRDVLFSLFECVTQKFWITHPGG